MTQKQQGLEVYNTFCRYNELLYGSVNMTWNCHQLLHLATSVRRLGPLWSWSTRAFESFLFCIKKQVTGTQSVPHQLSKGILNHVPFLYRTFAKCVNLSQCESGQKDFKFLGKVTQSNHALLSNKSVSSNILKQNCIYNFSLSAVCEKTFEHN